MARLPEVGGDSGNWGVVLNDFLSVALSSTGALNTNSVGAPQIKPLSVTNATIANEAVSEAKLDASLTAKINAVAVPPVTSVSGKTGDISLVKADVGLNNVDNTSDANKPVSTATQTAINSVITDLSTKVTGPASSTANSVPRFNGTSGKDIQGSTVYIDSNNRLGVGVSNPTEQLSVAGNITATGTINGRNIATDASKIETYGMGTVVHGATAGTARPTGFACITWIGSVQPTNALTNDIWMHKA